MEWLELKIDTSPSGLDAVTALLEQQGITGVIIDDEADFKDFLEHNRQYWDYVDEDLLREKAGVSRVTFYLERNEDALNIVAQVRIAMSALKKEHPEYGPMLLTIDNVADADWENNWKKFYKPMEIGERLLVVPQWEETKARGRMKLVLNPGLTFGTGSHATTRLCLQSLDKYIHGGEECWIWAAAAVSCPSRRWCWGPERLLPATSTRSAWTWPTRTLPSMASARTATPCAGATC